MRRADSLTNFVSRFTGNLGASASWNPQGLSRPVQVIALPIQKQTGLVTCYGSLDDSCGPPSMQFSISRPVIYISLDPLTSTWLPSDLQQAPFWSKLSPLVRRHLTLICSTPICMFWDRGGTDFKCHWWLPGGLMCTVCYPCVMCTSKSE